MLCPLLNTNLFFQFLSVAVCVAILSLFYGKCHPSISFGVFLYHVCAFLVSSELLFRCICSSIVSLHRLLFLFYLAFFGPFLDIGLVQFFSNFPSFSVFLQVSSGVYLCFFYFPRVSSLEYICSIGRPFVCHCANFLQ